MSDRAIHQVIADLIPPGSRVLDLGCGDGALLAYLRDVRQCSGYGVEIDDGKVLECLSLFEDNSFDVVLQLDTLQHLRNTEAMLRETARVGRLGLVSFPNFAHWPHRLSVLRGRMPVTKALPYQWYDTPNIRVSTFTDFEVLARKNGLRIIESFGLNGATVNNLWPNLTAATAVFKFERG